MQQQATGTASPENAGEAFWIADDKIRLLADDAVFFPTDFGRNMGLLLREKLSSGERVCELGLGTGVLAVLAGLKGARVVGLDKNPSAVALSRRNWELNGLPGDGADFRPSDLFSGIADAELGTFDAVWSNPPLLPDIASRPDDQAEREAFEIAGPLGRLVLDAMLSKSQDLLKPGGRMYTIATSIQGWERTRALLDEHWHTWQVVTEVDLELTSECGPVYIEWWKQQQSATGETYLYEENGRITHKLWFIEALKSG